MDVLCLHTAGLGALVADALRADIGASITYTDNSAALIRTSAAPEEIARLAYLKNAFAVLGSVPRRKSLPAALPGITGSLGRWRLPRTGADFRLMFSEDGQLVGVPAPARDTLQRRIAKATGGTFVARGGGEEFWTIARRDLDEVLFTRRLPQPKRRRPAKGELAPELAELIVSAAGPARPDDVILDPFAGSGALLAARASSPFRTLVCSDLRYAGGERPDLRAKRVRVLADDARTLPSLDAESVDVIITDPPWGEFAGEQNAAPATGTENDAERTAAGTTLITDALTAFDRVLRPGGAVVMLLSRRLAATLGTTWPVEMLRIDRQYELLVNGHPATLLGITKAEGDWFTG